MIAAVLGLLAFAPLPAVTSKPIAHGVKVGSLPVGGYSLQEAAALLSDVLSRPVVVWYQDRQWLFRPEQHGLDLTDPGIFNALYEAVAVGHRGSALRRVGQLIVARVDGKSIRLHLDDAGIKAFVEELVRHLEGPPVDAQLVLADLGQPQGPFGFSDFDGRKITRVEPDRPGTRVLREQLLVRLMQAMTSESDRQVEVPVALVSATVRAEQVARLGITHLLARFTTEFDEARSNRAHNIRLAAQKVHGTVVAPGGVFSLNDVVGPRTEAAGFKEAPVIVEGQFVPGIGGGVSQVATTVFNAALLANLQVIERHHHALAVQYVPLGQDATVWYGLTDLRFRNVSSGPLLITAEIAPVPVSRAALATRWGVLSHLGFAHTRVGSAAHAMAEDAPEPLGAVSAVASVPRQLTVSIYGRMPQPFLVELFADVAEEGAPGNTIYVEDATLPEGEQVEENPGAPIRKVNVWRFIRVKGSQGVQAWQDHAAYSEYRPEPRVVRIGTGKVQDQSAAPMASTTPLPPQVPLRPAG